jgi:hypothetical protein
MDGRDPVATEMFIDYLRQNRCPPVDYRPPPAKQKWKMFLAAGLLPLLSGTDKAVLVCLIDHANPRTGRCDPSETTISAETETPLRTVERSIMRLREAGYLSRRRRMRSSNAYDINWPALSAIFEIYKRNCQRRRKNSGAAAA